MKLAAALLALIGVTHFSYDWIAMLYAEPDVAAKAWFYILRGIEGFALFAVLAAVAKSKPVFLVCLLGMFEEGLTAGCRASRPIGRVAGYEPFAGLCGQTWYFVGLTFLGLIACGLLYEFNKKRRYG